MSVASHRIRCGRSLSQITPSARCLSHCPRTSTRNRQTSVNNIRSVLIVHKKRVPGIIDQCLHDLVHKHKMIRQQQQKVLEKGTIHTIMSRSLGSQIVVKNKSWDPSVGDQFNKTYQIFLRIEYPAWEGHFYQGVVLHITVNETIRNKLICDLVSAPACSVF